MNFDKFNQLVEEKKYLKKMPEATNFFQFNNPACGDDYNFYLNIKNGIIEEASFETTGCNFSIATFEILCDLIRGKTVDVLYTIQESDFDNYVDGYPERRKSYIETALNIAKKTAEKI